MSCCVQVGTQVNIVHLISSSVGGWKVRSPARVPSLIRLLFEKFDSLLETLSIREIRIWFPHPQAEANFPVSQQVRRH